MGRAHGQLRRRHDDALARLDKRVQGIDGAGANGELGPGLPPVVLERVGQLHGVQRHLRWRNEVARARIDECVPRNVVAWCRMQHGGVPNACADALSDDEVSNGLPVEGAKQVPYKEADKSPNQLSHRASDARANRPADAYANAAANGGVRLQRMDIVELVPGLVRHRDPQPHPNRKRRVPRCATAGRDMRLLRRQLLAGMDGMGGPQRRLWCRLEDEDARIDEFVQGRPAGAGDRARPWLPRGMLGKLEQLDDVHCDMRRGRKVAHARLIERLQGHPAVTVDRVRHRAVPNASADAGTESAAERRANDEEPNAASDQRAFAEAVDEAVAGAQRGPFAKANEKSDAEPERGAVASAKREAIAGADERTNARA